MIIQYDTRPDATVDEKLRSLIESIQLAFSEVGIDATNTATSQSADISEVLSEIRTLADSVSSISGAITQMDGQVTALEESIASIEETLTSLDERVTALENPEP